MISLEVVMAIFHVNNNKITKIGFIDWLESYDTLKYRYAYWLCMGEENRIQCSQSAALDGASSVWRFSSKFWGYDDASLYRFVQY